jgi:hypothetical protein
VGFGIWDLDLPSTEVEENTMMGPGAGKYSRGGICRSTCVKVVPPLSFVSGAL